MIKETGHALARVAIHILGRLDANKKILNPFFSWKKNYSIERLLLQWLLKTGDFMKNFYEYTLFYKITVGKKLKKIQRKTLNQTSIKLPVLYKTDII